ncbi:hypothetical protein PAN31117_03328 [Pandoraea anapnoica]|uniref:Uncharacterized protein n=1 Tax=Pandoraea anapnoica TaxID=2508301 RepID=A0A5E5A8F0_9BURK|nr:hypothetical protein PAN31117_03328 [Pandoraea anapnoica]
MSVARKNDQMAIAALPYSHADTFSEMPCIRLPKHSGLSKSGWVTR